MPREYQLIPVNVTAIKLTPESVERAAQFSGGIQVEEIDPFDRSRRFVALNIPTLYGMKRASEGEYIVKDQKGIITIMSPSEFESKYQEI